MAAFFLDTSALFKRYAREEGTDYVAALTDPADGHSFFVSRITFLELTATVARRRKGHTIRPEIAEAILARVSDDFANRFEVVELSEIVFAVAVKMAERHALRAYDAMQLGSASLVALALDEAGQSLTFVSSDRELNDAAGAERLMVINPAGDGNINGSAPSSTN